MRILLTKIATLGLVASIVFGTVPIVSAQAQDVTAALITANNTNATGDQLVAAGNVLVAALKAAENNPALTASILSDLAKSGNANLISGVLAAPDLPAGALTGLAGAVVASGNATLIATVVVLSSNAGKAGSVSAMSTALAASPNAAVVQNAIAAIAATNSSLGTTFGGTVAATATANGNTVVAAAAAAGEKGTPAATPIASGGTPALPPVVILPSPSQTVTGSIS